MNDGLMLSNFTYDIVNKILEFMPNTSIVHGNEYGWHLARDRASHILQRAYKKWIADKDVVDIRIRIKRYVPLMFRDSFRNDLAISVSITRCNTIAYIWMTETNRLMSKYQHLSIDELRNVHIQSSRFVARHREKIYNMRRKLEDIFFNMDYINDASVYGRTTQMIESFIMENSATRNVTSEDEFIIVDIIFRIQEMITMWVLQDMSIHMHDMDLCQLVDVACDNDIYGLIF